MSKKFSSHIATQGNAALPVLFLIITAGILIAGGIFVYKTVSKTPGNPLSEITNMATSLTGQGAMKLSENDFKDISDPLIRKHFAKQYSQPKYRSVSTSNGMGVDSTSTVEIETNSASDFRVHTLTVEGGKESQNMIIIGDTTYIKDPKDGKWWFQKQEESKETGDEVAEKIKEYTPETVKEMVTKTNTTYTKIGEEPCGSLTCHKYEEVSGESDSGKRTFWFDTKDLLLRKEQHGYGEFVSETTYSYDTISVSVPSPTKPVPEGKSIYEVMVDGMSNSLPGGVGVGAGKMPTKEELDKLTKEMMQYSSDDSSVPTDDGDGY